MRARSIAISVPSGFAPLRSQLLSPSWFAPRANRRSAPSPTTPTFTATNFTQTATFTQTTTFTPTAFTSPGRSVIDGRMTSQAPKRRKLSTSAFVEVFPADKDRVDAAGTGVCVGSGTFGI